MKIIYVHHGNRAKCNPPSQTDDLTPLGVEDCKIVGRLLDDENIKSNLKAIYTSPILRCRKTAEIINKNLNAPIIEDVRLNEFGSVPHETWLELQARIAQFLDEIVVKFDESDIVICVTSGVNLVGFINKAYHLSPSSTAPFFLIPSCSPIMIEYKKE